MNTQTITTEAVALKAIELADANPAFVYVAPELEVDNEFVFENEDGELVDMDGYTFSDGNMGDCRYVHKTEAGPVGGCLYGQALLALGMAPSELSGHEGDGIASVIEPGTNYLDQARLTVALGDSQSLQDGGEPWAKAIEPVKAFLAKRDVAA